MEPLPTSGGPADEHEELVRRLTRLEDERAIERLKNAYTAALDGGYDLDRICSLFTEDGRWAATGFGDYRGHAEIREFFAGLAGEIAYAHHYASAPSVVVTPDGAEATGEWGLLCVSGRRHRDDPSVHLPVVELGRYHDRLVKRDGRWLFAELRVDVTMSRQVADLLNRPSV